MTRRTSTLIALCVFAVIIAGWLVTRTTAPPSSSPDATTTSAGVPTCPLSTLPPEVADTVDAIATNGPFPFPRNDGVVFGNREGHLPAEERGYYHEYTVRTPGASNRSTRRVVTGGLPLTDPAEYFYTGDHYDSFCLVSGIEGQS